MPHKDPPIHTRFPVNRPARPHTQKHPNGYLTPLLNKLLNKKMTVNDPEVKRILETKPKDKTELKKILVLRWILNGIQGENDAIKEIFNRVDGKISDILIDQSQHTHITVDREGIIENVRKAVTNGIV